MRIQILFFLLAACAPLAAQEPNKLDLAPCGTAPRLDPWLIQYTRQTGQHQAAQRSNDPIYPRIQAHLLARDNGTGRISPQRLLDAMCTLNADFAASGVRFYFIPEWKRIDSTAWFIHEDIVDGISMMFANNVPDALNAYFCNDPAGNCGYNLPYAGVAISHSCAAPTDHTWAHEVGHALTLPHPFIGWEGKTYSYGTPTPDTLTYDYTHFHSTPDTIVPAPLDTALVELVDGSNCSIAADRICDTKPDYLSARWFCDSQGFSTIKQKDPNGVDFYSDGSLFMSYASDECQNRFSDDQIDILRANLQTQKLGWLEPGPPAPFIDGVPTPLTLLGGESAPLTGALLSWTPTAGATHYLVQVSRVTSFSLREVDVVTTDTFLILPQLLSLNTTYYWRVRPFNGWEVCTGYSTPGSFKTTPVSAASEPDADGWRCYPTLLTPGQAVYAELPAAWQNQAADCIVYDAVGRVMWAENQLLAGPRAEIRIPAESWPPGLYRLTIRTAGGIKVHSLVIPRN